MVSRQGAATRRANLTWHTKNLLEEGAVAELLEAVDPDAVIHTAALADIDFCEAHKDLARVVNTGLTASLAASCDAQGAKLVFCSTDTVFDGERGDYVETDATRPVNFYGQTKVAAEEAVLSYPRHVVARLALVMGLPLLGSGNSFLARWLPALEEGREVGVPNNELRTPVDVVTLGKALLELSGNDFAGVIHLSGNDKLNRYEMAQRVARRLGYDPAQVVVSNPESIPGRAPRPRDASMVNARARAVLETPMVDLETGLELVLAAHRGKNA